MSQRSKNNEAENSYRNIKSSSEHQGSDEIGKKQDSQDEIIINSSKETSIKNDSAANKNGTDSGSGLIKPSNEKDEDAIHNNHINSSEDSAIADQGVNCAHKYRCLEPAEFTLNSITNLAKNAASFLRNLGGNVCAAAQFPSNGQQPMEEEEPVDYSTFNDNIVRLNVYGLPSFNQVISYTGLGVYHTGVQIYGIEYAYGGCPYPQSSIFYMPPRDIRCLSNISGRFQFVKTITIGETHFSKDEVARIIWSMGKNGWIGTNYHLLYNNCNTFSDHLCKTLCNKPIPVWINRLAYISTKFPFLINMLPHDYFTPVALQEKVIREQSEKQEKEKNKCPPAKQDEEQLKQRPPSLLTDQNDIKSKESIELSQSDKVLKKENKTYNLPFGKS